MKPFRSSRENLYAFSIETNHFVLFPEIITPLAALNKLCYQNAGFFMVCGHGTLGFTNQYTLKSRNI
jgi:hypothetical protein